MKINICDKALSYYKDELSLAKGDCVRFFVRYGGFNSFIKAFSLGLSFEEPESCGAKFEKDGITFFVENDDLWYFEEKDLVVAYNDQLNEPVFTQQ